MTDERDDFSGFTNLKELLCTRTPVKPEVAADTLSSTRRKELRYFIGTVGQSSIGR